MKKIVILLILCMLFTQSVDADELAQNAKSAYLMEESGKVLFEKNATDKMYPASMTKMMSLILVYEALKDGRLKESDVLTISENAASMGGSQVYLQVNEKMSVKDLLKSVCIASANDAMVALAEEINGSVKVFVEMMNKKSKEMGLVNTQFANTTGLHDENHYSCAKDMAMIAQKLIEIGGSHLLEITSTYDAYIREDTDNPFWLVNTNKLVKHVENVDGLKTGFTQEALSCITVTAKKENVRMIAVVMKEPDSKTRNKEVMDLIHDGFSKVEYFKLFDKNEKYSSFEFEQGLPHKTNLIYLDDVGVVVDKGEDIKIKEKVFTQTNFDLPIKQSEKIGEVTFTLDDSSKKTVDVGVAHNIVKMNFLDYFFMSFWRVLA